MNKPFLSLRNLAAAVLLFSGLGAIAQAAAPTPGKVVGVNQNARTFTVQWIAAEQHHHFTSRSFGSVEKTYKTTDKTAFIVGGKKGSWADIKKGTQVTILAAHSVGSDRVVDKVEIVSGT
jgi:hypothetical protein